MASIYQQLQFRRGTQAEWDSYDPVLMQGEPGYATDAFILKIGDGTTPWSSLSGLPISGGIALSSDTNTVSGVLEIVSGIAVFASGEAGHTHEVSQSELDGVSGVLDLVSGIAVFASGDTSGGGDVSQSEFDIVSGISVYSSGQVGLLNTSSGALNTSVGLLETASGALNTDLGIVSGIAVYGSGQAGGGGDVTQSEFDIVSGIAVYASGTDVANDVTQGEFDIVSGIAIFASGKALEGGGDGPSSSQFNIVSGIAVFSSGQDALLTTASGALNTSVGLLETASGALNTSVGTLETDLDIVSGISVFASGQDLTQVHSRSGDVTYSSTASGNISGVLNVLFVDQAAYNALNKDSNTIYFIP